MLQLIFIFISAEAIPVESFLLVGVNNLLSGMVVRVQTDYYSYEFGLRKLGARV